MAAGSIAIGVTCAADNVPQEGRIHIYRGDTIVMVGDSLTSGVVNAPWFNQMKAAADAFYSSRGLPALTWVNSGLGGSGSVYFKDNIASIINAHNPDLVIIAYGINDINNGSVPTLQAHIDNMNEGLALITGNPRLAFCSPFERQAVAAADIRAMRTAQANDLARPRGAAFVDWRAYADSLSASALAALLVDGLHPTEPAGNAYLSGITNHQVAVHAEAGP